MTFNEWFSKRDHSDFSPEAIVAMRRHWKMLQGHAVPNEKIAEIFDFLIEAGWARAN